MPDHRHRRAFSALRSAERRRAASSRRDGPRAQQPRRWAAVDRQNCGATSNGRWDYQEGVPGRGDARVIPSMWYSIELQATTPVPEWGGQAVRMAQEEDAIIGADGRIRWALRRQDKLFLIR